MASLTAFRSQGTPSCTSSTGRLLSKIQCISNVAMPARGAPMAPRLPTSLCRAQHRRSRRDVAAFAVDEVPTESGGGSGSGDSGDSGSGSGDGRGDSGGDGPEENPGLGANIWGLVCAAAAALGILNVGSRQLQKRKQEEQARALRKIAGGGADKLDDEVSTLTRLTQEAFADLVKVKARLDELEAEAGIASSAAATSAPPGASLVSPGTSSRRSSSSSSNGSGNGASRVGATRTGGGVSGSGGRSGGQGQHSQPRLSGVLRLGGGLLWAEEEEAEGAAGELQAAGLKLGTDALLQLGGRVRGGRDSVQAECRVDTAAERLSLRKVLYNCRLGAHLRVVLAPFGARGRDAAYTLNPLAGQGLSGMVRDGSPLHRPVLGSLVGVALEASRAWLNAGYFARALPEGGASSSLMAQLVLAPTNNLSAGLTLVEHRSDAAAGTAGTAGDGAITAAGSSSGGSEDGSFVGGGQGTAVAAVGALEQFLRPLLDGLAGLRSGSAGAESRQLGAMLALRLGQHAVVHGWAAADASEVERCVRSGQYSEAAVPQQWGLSLGSYPDGSGSGWLLGAGRSSAVAAAAGTGSGSGSSLGRQLLPNLFELSLQMNLGEGLLVTPGMMLVVTNGSKPTSAFLGVRTAWAF